MNTVLTASPEVLDDHKNFRTILGVKFFVGDAPSAIRRLSAGGLLVVPAAPALKNLPHDAAYREALLGADIAITDSIFMVRLWNLLERDSIRRLSGLEYLRVLLQMPEIRAPRGTYWIMANPDSARKNMDWLNAEGVEVTQDDVYLAPFYGSRIDDQDLLARLNERTPRHIIVTIGGGNQETAWTVPQAESRIPADDSLYRRRNCVSQRRPGAHSELGGPVGPGMAAAQRFAAATLRSSILGCAQAFAAHVAVSEPIAD